MEHHKRRRMVIIILFALVCSLGAKMSVAQTGLSGPTSSSEPVVNGSVYEKPGAADTPTGAEIGKGGVELNLQQAIELAMQNNPDVLSVQQDVYLREQDVEKAHYFSDQIKQVEDDADYGEDMLALLKQQLALIPDPNDPAFKPTYDYLQAQITAIEEKMEDAAPYRIDNYSNAKVAYLYEQQARTGLSVTKTAVKVAHKKVALLVSKQYFDVIKYRDLAEVKRLAWERAKKQAEIAKASWESGFRAKDDYLLAKAQVELMQADYRKSVMEWQNAETELKATIGLKQTIKISLVNHLEGNFVPELDQGLQQGLHKRLEIQKAQGELEIAKLGFQIAASYLSPGVVDYEQARINVRKAEIELQRQQTNVEKDIRQAYESVTELAVMKSGVAATTDAAEESLSIAELRYREGYSIPSPIMKALNAEDLAGTTVEVLAAQEKLMEVEEKVVGINYNYNLAKANYLLSTGEGL